MRLPLWIPAPFQTVLSILVIQALTTAPAQAQYSPRGGSAPIYSPSPCPAPEARPYPQTPTVPSMPTTPTTPAPEPAAALPVAALFTPEAGAAVGGGQASFVGYIDTAIPYSHLRLRYDTAYGNNRPDRAEWFYPKCGCLGPGSPGPPRPETNVDYQDISAYLEAALTPRFSVFVDAPVRFLNPEQNDNTAGYADMNFGFKYAFVYTPDTVATLGFRTYVPTGDAGRGLGTDHVSLEPELLLYRRLTERLFFEGELRDWIPIGGTPGWPGNVIRYGVGLSYLALDTTKVRFFPVVEFVGWSVLDGKQFAVASVNPPVGEVQEAGGDTIVNVKFGVRVGFGEVTDPGMISRSDLYVGYGRALTGEVWYKEILRVEYRLRY